MGRVSKPAADSKPVRMFVALDLPERVREDIAIWGEAELTDPALRRVPLESLHVTLAFIGARPEEEVARIAQIVRESADPAPWLELLDPVQRPPRGRARLYALPVLSPGAEALQGDWRKDLSQAASTSLRSGCSGRM